MGHGIGPAAIMGRLRTSVQTLAALDLPPEQVLRHLDDIARCENAAAPGVTPDELCEILMRTLDTQDREDDVALLIARLHRIPCSNVAQWLLEPQPTTPGLVRRMVRRTLDDWGISSCTDTAELL